MLESGFRGRLYPVNSKHTEVQGQRAYALISDISDPVELAVIATPPQTVPGIVESCGVHGVNAAVIITAGFGEAGREGAALEKELLETARRYGIRLIGPNCLGIMRPAIGLMAPANMEALEDVLLRVSEMVCELPLLKEMDINPLILDEHGVLAADARVVVEYRQPGADRYAHMSIYPYPAQLVSQWQLADGTDITIRPIRPEDAELVQAFVRGLSEESKYFRFMSSMHELTETMLVRFTQIDYSREMALIAVTLVQGREVELGVARYAINPDGDSCEFALVVADSFQGKGLGQKLMSMLMEAARSKGLNIIEGEVLSNNHNMLKLMMRLGFAVKTSDDDQGVMKVSRAL